MKKMATVDNDCLGYFPALLGLEVRCVALVMCQHPADGPYPFVMLTFVAEGRQQVHPIHSDILPECFVFVCRHLWLTLALSLCIYECV